MVNVLEHMFSKFIYHSEVYQNSRDNEAGKHGFPLGSIDLFNTLSYYNFSNCTFLTMFYIYRIEMFVICDNVDTGINIKLNYTHFLCFQLFFKYFCIEASELSYFFIYL